MCRFVAYLGKAPLVLSQILEAPENSLINQSSAARLASCINADGFGVAWYNHEIDETPGLFKSIQPAWNDPNLCHLAKKISSACILGHVRASTVGSVSNNNCHPFAHGKLAFEHNGTIRNFEQLRRKLLLSLSEEAFNLIRGNTDSEHFFALLYSHLPPLSTGENWTVEQLAEAFLISLALIEHWQTELNNPEITCSHLNSVLTDGQSLLVSRYTSNTSRPPLSLYYSNGKVVADALNLRLNSNDPFMLIASEPLDGNEQNWHAVPQNHLLMVRPDLSFTLRKIEIPYHAS